MVYNNMSIFDQHLFTEMEWSTLLLWKFIINTRIRTYKSIFTIQRNTWIGFWSPLCFSHGLNNWPMIKPLLYINAVHISRVTLYTAGHLHTAVPHCSHSRAPIVHTAVPRENNEHGCVYLRWMAVCKLPGCVEGHPCTLQSNKPTDKCIFLIKNKFRKAFTFDAIHQ